jgi:hypothetical protein
VFIVGADHVIVAVPFVTGVTVAVALCDAEPPEPVQVSVKLVVVLIAPVD